VRVVGSGAGHKLMRGPASAEAARRLGQGPRLVKHGRRERCAQAAGQAALPVIVVRVQQRLRAAKPLAS